MEFKTAGKYFSYIGKQFPVMCASGIFPLMPPVKDVALWLDRLDDLSRKGITKHVTKLARFKRDFELAETKADNALDRATARTLALSASGAITELDLVRTWEKSPALYLQVAFIGLEQAVDMPSKSAKTREKRFIKRLKAIPALLELAPKNIEAISHTSRGAAQTMIRDCARFLTELGKSDLGTAGKAPRHLADSLSALRDYDKFVSARSEIPETEGPTFSQMAENVVGTNKSAQEIYAIAEDEFNRRTESLKWLESEVDSDWQTGLGGYQGPSVDEMEAMDVIIREIHRLRGFFFETALPSVFNDSGLRIEPQSLHQASTLRPIHYDPALGAWPDEPSRCQVSPQIFSGRGFRDDPTRLARMRREFIFMTARQTYPGRHLLDTQRRSLADSPLSQVTNPLFMAGWLAFAENLLDELGYLQTPMDRLVHHQRGLARAALAMIDAGLAVGNLDQDKCLIILTNAGFSQEESLDRVRAIRLAPASRVMPVLGLHELTSLRKESGLDLNEFCKKLFAHGQLPLDSIRELITS